MVELGETGCHLSAARSWCRDDDKRLGGLDVIVLSVAVIAYNVGNVVRVAIDRIMTVYFDSEMFKLCFKDICGCLAGVAGDDHAAHIETLITVFLDETQYVRIVGDAKIVADLVFLNVCRIDGNDDLSLVCQLQKHVQLAVRRKAWQDTGSVIIVEQLSAELQVQLVSELADPLADVFRLHF